MVEALRKVIMDVRREKSQHCLAIIGRILKKTRKYLTTNEINE